MSRAYTGPTFGIGKKRREGPGVGASSWNFAELVVPRKGANTAHSLIRMTMDGIRVLRRQGGVFVLENPQGAWKLEAIKRYIGRHLPFEMRLKIRPLTGNRLKQALTGNKAARKSKKAKSNHATSKHRQV